MGSAGRTARHRVLIADDDPLAQAALNLFAVDADFEVVGVAGDSEQAIELAAAHQPDAALVDVDMPGGGLRAVQGIRLAAPSTAMVILSGDESDGHVRQLLAGATAYCRKGMAPEVLTDWVRRSIEARTVVPQEQLQL
jgi:DNA-binding NarL/FixJ family response regulator